MLVPAGERDAVEKLVERHLREQFPEQPGELGILLLGHRRQIVHHCTACRAGSSA